MSIDGLTASIFAHDNTRGVEYSFLAKLVRFQREVRAKSVRNPQPKEMSSVRFFSSLLLLLAATRLALIAYFKAVHLVLRRNFPLEETNESMILSEACVALKHISYGHDLVNNIFVARRFDSTT